MLRVIAKTSFAFILCLTSCGSPISSRDGQLLTNDAKIETRNLSSIANLGFAGANTIRFTIDGGNKLLTVGNLESTAEVFEQRAPAAKIVNFLDEANGWMIGGINQLYTTSDGGRNWSPRTSEHSFMRPHALKFVNSMVGWAADENYVLRTNDGGFTWTKSFITKNHQDLGGSFFLDAFTAWVAEDTADGTLLHRTTDAGSKWISSKITTSNLRNVFFVDKTTGYALLGLFETQELLRSTDGGDEWEKVGFPEGFQARSMSWQSLEVGALAGYFPNQEDRSPMRGRGAVLLTTDAGKSWRELDISEPSPFFQGLLFFDDNRAVLSSRDSVYITVNGGITWEMVFSNMPRH